MPKVTVLMAVYNHERFVSEAIDSVLAQSFQDFEFLIINDGSTDQTREVILSYEDSRIHLVDNENNLGLTRSLNKGLNLAQGEFIARLDSDDISEPERLARQVAFMEVHPETVLVGSWYREIDEQGNLLKECALPCTCTQIRWGLLFYTPFLNSSVMFRRTLVLLQVGLYNEDFIYAQDHEFWARIACSWSVANLDEYLVKYRVHPSSISLFYETRQYELLFQSCKNYMSVLLNRDNFDKDLFKKIQSLLGYSQYQDCENLDLERVDEVLQRVSKLSQAFCSYYNLKQFERETLLFEIGLRLIEIASDYAYRERYIGWRFLTKACLLHKPIFFASRYQTTTLKLLMGPSLLKLVRRIRNEKINQLNPIN